MSTEPSARELAGRVLAVGLPGSQLGPAELELLDDVRPAGVIVFTRNVPDAPALHALCRAVEERLGSALLLIDQEGGRVDRLRAIFGKTPPARVLAAAGLEAVAEAARCTAESLSLLGLNVNCVPCLDLDEGHEDNGIGDRSFGTEPDAVVEMAAAVLEAHASRQVATSLKHFPGLGRTRGDTHDHRPVVSASREELEARELAPFRALIPQAPAVMVSHAAYEALSGPDAPASMSASVATGLLREELGFTGVVVTDDLDMGGVADRTMRDGAVSALSAGCDLLLACQDVERAVEARDGIAEALSAGALPRERVQDAACRVDGLRSAVRRPPAVLDEERLARLAADFGALRRRFLPVA